MIKSLVVSDFQSHRLTELDFVSGVNVICGLSQSGKSALLRAFTLVVDNRPSGDGFIRHGCKQAIVGLTTDVDGRVASIIRTKGKDENTYEVTVNGSKLEPFKAFGVGVPEVVSEILNMSDINIQDQLSPYFLVLDSPGQIALYIRKVAKLDEIDDVVSLLSSKARDVSSTVNNLGIDEKEKKEKLTELEKFDFDKFEKAIQKLELFVDEKNDLEVSVDIIQTSLNEVNVIDVELQVLCSIDFKILDSLVIRAQDSITELLSVQASCESLREVCDDLTLVLSSTICLPDSIEEDLVKCGKAFADYKKGVSDYVLLNELVDDFCNFNVSISVCEKKLKEDQLLEKQLFARLTVCPYCKSDLSEKEKTALLESLNV